jgi:8-oxo-dGTP pyrophosphatase MutT (NUDIX family)
MTRRIDYYHDPQAPPAHSLHPGAAVLAVDDAGRILLQRRVDSGDWSLPGGMMEIGESIGATAIRETREETGLDVELTGILGIHTDPGHLIAYDDGTVRQEFSVVFRAKVIGGHPAVSEESTDVRFVDPAELDAMPMNEWVRLGIRNYLDGGNTPYFG